MEMNSQILSRLRMLPPGLMALAVSMPIAWVSLSKFILVISGTFLFLIILIKHVKNQENFLTVLKSVSLTHNLVLLSFFLAIVSAFWSSGSETEIIKSILQHGNLLIIPLLALHLRNKEEAIVIFKIYTIGQIFIIISSWLIFIGFRPPWAFDESTGYAVFSSYLDQSIMNAIFAAMLWHLRFSIFPKKGNLTIIPILLAIVVVFYILQGRSGHVVMFGMLCLAIWWQLPKKLKLLALAAPLVLITLLSLSSDVISLRFKAVAHEIEGFTQQQDATTSTGIRLDFWLTSLQMVKQNPVYGSGAGSWSNEFHTIKNLNNEHRTSGNPHQEYLLWSVEFGVLGVVMLLAIFASIYLSSKKMELPEQHATLSVMAGVMVACLFNCALHDALIGDHLSFLLGLCITFGSNKL
jgi:O-antigen ligase